MEKLNEKISIDEFLEFVEVADKYTYRQIFETIEKLGLTNIPAYPIEKNAVNNNNRTNIYRARKCETKAFNHVRDLSYNPNPRSIDRASTPCTPMFYGAVSTNQFDIPLITNFAEIVEVIRTNSIEYDEEKITIGEFELNQDIIAAAITFNEDWHDTNPQYIKLYNDFKNYKHDDFKIIELFSFLFSLKEDQRYYNNRVTSVFVDYLFSIEKPVILDAIIYPSVRLGGEGTNIAFHPEAVDEFLVCKRVKTYKLYMKGGFVLADTLQTANVEQDGSFNLVDYEKTMGDDVCKNELKLMIDRKKE